MLKQADSFLALHELTVPRIPAPKGPGTLRKTFPWAAKGGLAILDQALFAGANFVVNVLLARWLTSAEYGAFALAFSIFLLIGVFHTAIFTEPMLVFGPGRYRDCFPEYLRILLRGHFSLMVPGCLIVAAVALLVGRMYSVSLGWALLGLAISAPLILLLWLVRRAFYVHLRPGWAATGGLVYMVLLVGLIGALWAKHRLSLLTAFVAMGVAALGVSVFLMLILDSSRTTAERGTPSARTVFSDHGRYGRWSAATAGIIWLPSNISYLLLPIWAGLQGTGALKALMNLAMPALQTISSLSLILLPVLIERRKRHGSGAMVKTMRSFFVLFLFGSTLYLVLLWEFRFELFRLLYAGKYAEYAFWPLLLTGVLPLGASVTAVISNALRALERPDWIFWCYLGSSIVAVVMGIPLILKFGVTGALLGQLLSSITAGVLMYQFYRKFLRNKVALSV